MFNYVAVGGILLSGQFCFIVLPVSRVLTNWTQGDRPFLYFEAVRGRLRSIFVARVKIGWDRFNQPFILYYDLNNSIYNEEDLITQQIAIDISTAYYVTKLREAQEALNILCYKTT